MTEPQRGFCFFTIKSGVLEHSRKAFLLCEKKYGTKLLRSGRISPEQLLFSLLSARSLKLACVESCTGGWVSKILTDIPGSSRVFWGAVVAYSDEAKTGLLDVPREILEKEGAVSGETVLELVRNILKKSAADVGVAISGVAGPTGGTPVKPVGTVWLAAGLRGNPIISKKCFFKGSRDDIRGRAAAAAALIVESVVLKEENLDSF